jgi:dipeptidyl-peptidase-4
MNRWQNKLELLLADASSGKTSVMFTEENKRYIEINDFLTFFNRNQNFIWVSEVNGWMHVYNYSTKGQLVNEITKGEYDVTDCYGLDEKNGIVYYQSAEVSPLERYVYSIKLDGSAKKQITMQHGTNGAEFNPNFTYYMITHSDANTPADYAMFNAKGKQLRVLEDNHEFKRTLSKLELSKLEFFKFTTSDKVSLNGYMIKPTNFNPSMKYPVFMTFYGGPASQ